MRRRVLHRHIAIVYVLAWLYSHGLMGCAHEGSARLNDPAPPPVVYVEPSCPEPACATWEDVERIERVWQAYALYKDVQGRLRTVMTGGGGDLEDARSCLQRAHCEVIAETLDALHNLPVSLDCSAYRCERMGAPADP